MLRLPPGRAARLAAQRRLGIARRGTDLLVRKRVALLAERARWAGDADRARAEWERAAAEARRWFDRLAVRGGRRTVLEMEHARGAWNATVDVGWRSVMGVEVPVDVSLPAPPPRLTDRIASVGGTVAADAAVAAAAIALDAALRHASAQRALDALDAEIIATVQRTRLLERRRIPDLTAALAALELALDEDDRDQALRSRWARDRARR